jgi:hypothetical protein
MKRTVMAEVVVVAEVEVGVGGVVGETDRFRWQWFDEMHIWWTYFCPFATYSCKLYTLLFSSFIPAVL